MLENIEIIDYKCFKNLKLDGLSQINIISGGNNVGKTALLEVIGLERVNLVKEFGSTILVIALSIVAKNRNINNKKFKKFIENVKYNIISNHGSVEFYVKEHSELSDSELEIINKLNADYSNFLFINLDGKIDLLPVDNIKMNLHSDSYIDSSKPDNQDLVKLYSEIQTKGIQHEFLEYLQILDDNIKWLEPQLVDDELLLRVNLKKPKSSLISSELGEGTNRYIEILAILLSNKNKYVFIDEVENGIHYSKLKDIWKAIIEITQNQNLQLFVTTHDDDTIQTLVEASEEMEYKDITSIRLVKDEENNIFPIVMNADNLSFGVEMGEDFR